MPLEHVSTTTSISFRTNGKLKRRLLERGQHMMVTERFGQVDPQQKNKSKTSNWRRYNSLPRATAPLADGIPPAGKKLTYVDISCALEQYGDSVPITDQVQDTHEDPVLREAAKILGEQAGETIEEIRINFLKAGTNVFYANNVASRATVNSPPTRGDLRKIYRYFKNHKAREFTSIIKASGMIATEPVEGGYFAMGHTDLKADLRDIPGFIPVANYSDSMKALPNEVGSVEEFRFILTPMFEPWMAAGASGTEYLSNGVEVSSAASCDVYPLIFVARDSYAIVPLQGFNSLKMYMKPPGEATVSDQLAQLGFASWKTYQAGAILNQTWVARLECGATANPQ